MHLVRLALIRSKTPRLPAARGPSFATPAALLMLALAGRQALAQAPLGYDLLVSTTSDVGALHPQLPFLQDQDVLALRPGGLPRPVLLDGHWRAISSLVPGDIDGLGTDKSATQLARALRFSLLSDEGGFLDGDILGFKDGGGLEVIVSEATLVAALGLPAASLDVDAFDFDASGGLFFSLQNDLAATALGDLSDGDVLYLSKAGVLSRPYLEADVQQALAVATSSSSAVGDVQGLAIGPLGLCVVVQSPSAYDGAVLLMGTNPSLLVDEAGVGLGGAELDALAFAPATPSGLSVWFEQGGAPGLGRAVIEGPAFELVTLLPSAGIGYSAAAYFPGFGAWYLEPNDPLIAVGISQGLQVYALDAFGRHEFQVALQPGLAGLGYGGVSGYTFQGLSLSSAEVAVPLRVEF